MGNVEEAVNGNLLITEQPETFYMKNNYADETAVYDIEVSKKYESGKPVYFRWELYNKSRGSWKEIETDVAVLPDSNVNYRSECSFTVPGDKKNRYDESGVRCIVTCGNYSVRSDIVGLEKDPDPRPVARIQYQGCDGAHLTFKEYRDITHAVEGELIILDDGVSAAQFNFVFPHTSVSAGNGPVLRQHNVQKGYKYPEHY